MCPLHMEVITEAGQVYIMIVSDPSIRFEVKHNPTDIPETKIVEAFGDRKCPKLVEQIASPNLDVRLNALQVLCDEVNNPYSIFGVAEAGAVRILSAMCNDPDFTTRLRASKALSIMASDSNGLNAILEDQSVPLILKGMFDPSEEVRENIYRCILHVTRTEDGLYASVYAGVTESFAMCLLNELPDLKCLILRTLHNICMIGMGLENALRSNVVRLCIELLQSEVTEVRAEAARTLGFLCFSDQAKEEALQYYGVPSICTLLSNLEEVTEVKAAASMALMAITTTDEGKRQMNESTYINAIISMLYDESRVVKLNALKIISNIAVYPCIREVLKEDNSCVVVMKRLKNSEDSLVAKHANIAIDAVMAMP